MIRRVLTLLICAVGLTLGTFAPGAFGDPGLDPAGAADSDCVGDLVVPVNERLNSHTSWPSTTTVDLPSALAPGEYTVTVITSDGYINRSLSNTWQLQEQVMVTFQGAAAVGPTRDVPDGVDQAVISSTFDLSLDVHATWVRFDHVLSGVDQHHSLDVNCLAVTTRESIPHVDVSVVVDCRGEQLTVDLAGTAGVVHSVDVNTTHRVVVLDDFGVGKVKVPLPGDESLVSVRSGVDELFRESFDTSCVEDSPVQDEDQPVQPEDDENPARVDDAPAEVSGPPTPDDDSSEAEAPLDVPQNRSAPSNPWNPVVSLPTVELNTTLDCASSEIKAVLVNTGRQSRRVAVALARGPGAQSVDVAARSAAAVTLPLGDLSKNDSVEFLVVPDHGEAWTSLIPIDCQRVASAEVDVAVECSTRTAALTITNKASLPLEFVAFVERVSVLGAGTVAAGDSAELGFPVGAGPLDLRVAEVAGVDIFRETVAHGCDDQGVVVSLTPLCASYEIHLTIENTSRDPRRVLVLVGDSETWFEMSGFELVSVARALTSTPVNVAVESAFGDVLFREDSVAVDCEPEAVLADCRPGDAEPEWRVSDGRICSGMAVESGVDCASASFVASAMNESPVSNGIEVVRNGEVIRRAEVESWSVLEIELDLDSEDRLVVRRGDDRTVLTSTSVDCHEIPEGSTSRVATVLVGLASVLAAVVVKFDPWVRFQVG